MTPDETRGRLTAALATITAVWDDTLDPPRLGGPDNGGGGHTKPGTKLPIRADILDARTDTTGALAAWAEFINDELGICPVTGHIAPGLDGLVSWIREHLDWLTEHEAGPAAAIELDEHATTLDRIAHPDRVDAQYVGRCPVGENIGSPCGARLYWPRGAPDLTCKACGTTDDLTGWATRLADYVDEHLTAVQLAAHLSHRFHIEITPVLIRKWVHRGRIASNTRDHRGRPLYHRAQSEAACREHLDTTTRPPRRRHARRGHVKEPA